MQNHQDYNNQYPVGYQQQPIQDLQYGYAAPHQDYTVKHNTPEEEKVEKLLLVITWVSIFNCVMKMDYNVALYLFLYYVWVTRTNHSHYKAFLISNLVFVGLDTLWFLINMNSWAGGFDDEPNKYPIWLSFRVYRIFTLTIVVLIIILKLALAFFQYKCFAATQPLQPSSQHPAGAASINPSAQQAGMGGNQFVNNNINNNNNYNNNYLQ